MKNGIKHVINYLIEQRIHRTKGFAMSESQRADILMGMKTIQEVVSAAFECEDDLCEIAMKTAAESFLHPNNGTEIAFEGHRELAFVHEGCMQALRDQKKKDVG